MPSEAQVAGSSESDQLPMSDRLLHLERYLLLGTVALLPLIYAPNLFIDHYNTPKLTLLCSVVAVAAALRLAALLLGAPAEGLKSAAWPALASAGALLVSWAFTDLHGWSVLGLWIRYGGLLPYLACILFALLLADACAGSPRPILFAAAVGASGVGVGAIVQMLFSGFELGERSPGALVTSTIGNSNFLGGYLAIALPLCVGLWMGSGWSAKLGMITTICVGSGLLFTMSQGGWIAAVAGLAVFIGHRGSTRRRWAWSAGKWIAGAVAVATVATVVVAMVLPHAYDRLPRFFVSTVHRAFLWNNALSLGSERPLFGWGPGAFAIQGPLNRSVEDALLTAFEEGDDPHSVPLAMFANLGVVGLAAFVFVAVWGFRRCTRTEANEDATSSAILAALVTYFIQSLVSLDEVALRFSLWVLVGAAACLVPRKTPVPEVTRPSRLRIAIAAVVVVMGLAGAVTVLTLIALPDMKIRRGLDLVGTGEFQRGHAEILAALALRNEFEYRRVLGGVLGRQAFEEGTDGGPYIEQMRQAFAYLDNFPDAQALTFYGESLNQWSFFDPDANAEALAIYRRAQDLDPHNPLVALDAADAHLQEGDPAAAEETLSPFERLLTVHYPEYAGLYSELWGGLAIARVQQGELELAGTTLERAVSVDGCRASIARELLALAEDRDPPLTLAGLICPSTMRQLLPPPSESTS